MSKNRIWMTISLLLLLLLAACGGTAAEPPADAMMEEESAMTDESMAEEEMADESMMADEEMMDDEEMADESMMDDEHDEMADESMMSDEEMMDDEHEETADEAMMDDEEMADEAMSDEMLAAWQTLPLTNARTGETFTLADFAGQTVFVEPMATWCTNCRQQLNNVVQAKADAGEDVVFVALSVETNISAADLAQYADSNGYDWVFAVMTPELLQALAADFGQTVSNPPSTPHFLIRPDGSFTGLTTGIESPDELLEAITAAQG